MQPEQQQRGLQPDSATACGQQATLDEITCHTVISVPAVDSQEQPECSQLGDSSSSSQQPAQQHQLQGTHEARQEMQFADLPQAWFRLLVRQNLTPRERLAMFQTCTSLAAAAARDCSRLSFTMWLDGRHSCAGLRKPLQLAASCTDIQLTLFGFRKPKEACVFLDVSTVRPCITQLTLIDVPLNSQNISSLHLEQLIQLHTIELDSASKVWPHRRRHSSYVDASALRQALPCGGLPLLRHICCCRGMDGTDAVEVLEKLGPVLGHQVTQLTLDQDHWPALTVLSKWPAVTRLQLAVNPSSCSPVYTEGDTSKAVQQLFKQGLKEVSIPAVLLEAAYDIDSSTSCAVEQLELLGKEVSTAVLAKLPMHGVSCLVIPGYISDDDYVPDEALLNLKKCRKVVVVPSTWGIVAADMIKSSIPSSTPTLDVAYNVDLLQWLTRNNSSFHGAFVACNYLYHYGGDVGVARSQVLQHLPEGVHQLVIQNGLVASGYTWQQFMASIV